MKFQWYVRNIVLGILFIGKIFASDSVMKFVAIGDYGVDSRAEARIAQLVKRSHPEFVITLGDNNYPNGCWDSIDHVIGKYYHRYIGNYKGQYGKGSLQNRFYPSLGNHDWHALSRCPMSGHRLPYMAYFTLPGQQYYYDFVKGPVHFFALDSDDHEPDGITMDSVQYQWFVKQVKASNAPFKIVYFHHPPYSSGAHGPSKAMQWNFAELGIDLVMAGHDHSYERIERDGVVYIVNGAGGQGLTKLKERDPASKIYYNRHHGFNLITVTKNTLLIEFIDTKKRVQDLRVIQKHIKE